jgi:two-component system sensor histidine kinase UhpB
MAHFDALRRSLRLRLLLLPALILFFGIGLAAGLVLYNGPRRLQSEIRSNAGLGSLLIKYALEEQPAAAANGAQSFGEKMGRLERELKNLRHITVVYAETPSPSPATPTYFASAETGEKPKAPDWFLNLFDPPKILEEFPVYDTGELKGRLVMMSHPADEVAEIWSDLYFVSNVLAIASLALLLLIPLMARVTLKPLHQLIGGLRQLGRGQYDELSEMGMTELAEIGEAFNQLASTLAQSKADNHLLIDRLISIQENERRDLARELHDEFGAALFGIRAAASCIDEIIGNDLPSANAMQEIAGQTQRISCLANTIQNHNYKIMERIRPAILHQMGLPDALQQLVQSWLMQNRQFACALEIEPGLPPLEEDLSLIFYRIVQESLTNIGRHSQARHISICLALPGALSGSQETLAVTIQDDGVGLGPDFKMGFGFLGMNERVRKAGGYLKIQTPKEGGTRIVAAVPFSPTTGAKQLPQLTWKNQHTSPNP